jgi:predicted permease
VKEALLKVLSFAFVICIGIAFSKLGSLGDGAGRLISKVVFNLTLPCAIVSAFGSADFHAELLGLTALGFVVTAMQFFLSLLVYSNLDKREITYQLSNVTGYNIGCFALAFIQEFFPPSAVIAACLFDAGNALMGTGGTLCAD